MKTSLAIQQGIARLCSKLRAKVAVGCEIMATDYRKLKEDKIQLLAFKEARPLHCR